MTSVASASSPTYSCASDTVPLVDSSSSYCIVPGGHPRMEICCGASNVQYRPDCYSYCALPDTYAFVEDDWTSMANAFFDCLMADGGRKPAYAICQPETGEVAQNNNAPVTYAPYGVATWTSTGGAALPTFIFGSKDDEWSMRKGMAVAFIVINWMVRTV